MSQEFSPIATGVAGTTTNDSAAAGMVGESVFTSVTSNTNVPNLNNAFGDLASISLTAGDWDVSAGVMYATNGATVSRISTGIGLVSGNNSTGLVNGTNAFEIAAPGSSTYASAIIPPYRLSLSATTTVYLKTYQLYSVATPQYTCSLFARRAR